MPTHTKRLCHSLKELQADISKTWSNCNAWDQNFLWSFSWFREILLQTYNCSSICYTKATFFYYI